MYLYVAGCFVRWGLPVVVVVAFVVVVVVVGGGVDGDGGDAGVFVVLSLFFGEH